MNVCRPFATRTLSVLLVLLASTAALWAGGATEPKYRLIEYGHICSRGPLCSNCEAANICCFWGTAAQLATGGGTDDGYRPFRDGIRHFPYLPGSADYNEYQIFRGYLLVTVAGDSITTFFTPCRERTCFQVPFHQVGTVTRTIGDGVPVTDLGECASHFDDIFQLSGDELAATGSYAVVGPTAWKHPYPIPAPGSGKTITVGVKFGPPETRLRPASDTFRYPLRLRLMVDCCSSYQRWFLSESPDLELNAEWDGMLYIYDEIGPYPVPASVPGIHALSCVCKCQYWLDAYIHVEDAVYWVGSATYVADQTGCFSGYQSPMNPPPGSPCDVVPTCDGHGEITTVSILFRDMDFTTGTTVCLDPASTRAVVLEALGGQDVDFELGADCNCGVAVEPGTTVLWSGVPGHKDYYERFWVDPLPPGQYVVTATVDDNNDACNHADEKRSASITLNVPGPGEECAEGSDLFEKPNGSLSKARPTSQNSAGVGSPGGESDPCDPIDPVYLFSGEFYEEVEDLRIQGRGLDFVWARKYRSRVTTATAHGNGWDFSYNVFLTEDPEGIIVHDGNSRADLYRQTATDTWTCTGQFRELTRQTEGTYTLMYEDGGKWVFQPFNAQTGEARLAMIRDRNGNCLTLEYGESLVPNRLTGVVDTLGRHTLIHYNTAGHIDSVMPSVAGGNGVTYRYYGEEGVPADFGSPGDLKSVTSLPVTATPNGNDFPQGKTTVYTYDTSPHPKLKSNLLTITDPKGNTYLRNIYFTDPTSQAFDRIRRQIWGDPDDVVDVAYGTEMPTAANGHAVRRTLVCDRVGNLKEYLWDARNRCTILREYTGRATHPALPVSKMSELAITTPPVRPTDPLFFETRYSWNAESLQTKIVYPNGNIVEKIYEIDLVSTAAQRMRGNLRVERRRPGTHVPAGDQTVTEEQFEYDTGFGDCGSCGGFNFVKKHTDARGKVTLCDFDTRGNVTAITHPIAGCIESFEYNTHGQMILHVLPDNGLGHRRNDRFLYYESGPQTGYLWKEVIDDGGLALTTTYEHDAWGNVTRRTEPGGSDTIYHVNQLGQTVRIESPQVRPGLRYFTDIFYDANDNIAHVDTANIDETGTTRSNPTLTTSYGYDILNNLTTVTREVSTTHSVVTSYDYDRNRNRTLVRLGEATAGRQPDNTVRVLYDERDMPWRSIHGDGGAEPATREFAYDANGNAVRLVVGTGDGARAWEATYDAYDRMVLRRDPMGNTIEYSYDPNSNPVRRLVRGELDDKSGATNNVRLAETAWVHDDLNRPERIENEFFDPKTQGPLGTGKSVTAYGFSPASQLLSRTVNNTRVTHLVHDTAGRVAGIVDAKGNSVACELDPNGNVLSSVATETDGMSTTDTFVVEYAYDGLDRLTTVTDGSGNVTGFEFDSLDAIVKTSDAERPGTHGPGNIVRYSYDGLGRRTATVRELTQDGIGGTTVTGAIVTTQEWDDSGRVVSQTDGNGNATVYVYDGLSRQVSAVYADGTSETVAYNSLDDPLRVEDPNGSVVLQQFDGLGRLARRDVAPGPGVAGTTTFEAFGYDGHSRLVSAANDISLVTREYDSLSNETSETLHGLRAAAHSISSSYDENGNRIKCSYPSGRTITRQFDALNRTTHISDGLSTVATYSYIGPGRVARRDYGNGTHTVYEYDGIEGQANADGDYGFGRLKRTRHRLTSDGSSLDNRVYYWSRTQNKTRHADVRPGGPQRTDYLGYDSASRLTSSYRTQTGSPDQSVSYGLDAVGNRTEVIGGPDAGLYAMAGTQPEPADRQVNQYTTTPLDTRTYDANGNLTSIVGIPPRDVPVLYDYAGRTVRYGYGTKGRAGSYYAYDALGRMITRGATAWLPYYDEITHYSYEPGWRIVEERDRGGETKATWVNGNGIDETLSMQRVGETYYYHTDDQHSVVAMTDSSGAVVGRCEYDDFGRPTFITKDGDMTSRGLVRAFTGRDWDPVAGILLCRNRVLDPSTGRFTTRDPLGLWGDPANLGNPTAYVGNNPWTASDPFGLAGPWYVEAAREAIGIAALTVESAGLFVLNNFTISAWTGKTRFASQFTSGYDPDGLPERGGIDGFLEWCAAGVNPADVEGLAVVGGIAEPILLANRTAVLGRSRAICGRDAAAFGPQTNSLGQLDTIEGVTPNRGTKGLVPVQEDLFPGLLPAEEPAVAQVLKNRAAGNAFRDELAELLRKEGRDVATEVYKRTPFGKRFIDIEVSQNGRVLGGIETKVGGSPYMPLQRLKDMWLRLEKGYRVNIARRR